ncbi:uncharacterized protein [Panulirus ornatus]|uniref:uncharacterized protein n=1 Tax=Panulirus ornatus TaxID=150431 RepID=UPI003A8A48B2
MLVVRTLVTMAVVVVWVSAQEPSSLSQPQQEPGPLTLLQPDGRPTAQPSLLTTQLQFRPGQVPLAAVVSQDAATDQHTTPQPVQYQKRGNDDQQQPSVQEEREPELSALQSGDLQEPPLAPHRSQSSRPSQAKPPQRRQQQQQRHTSLLSQHLQTRAQQQQQKQANANSSGRLSNLGKGRVLTSTRLSRQRQLSSRIDSPRTVRPITFHVGGHLRGRYRRPPSRNREGRRGHSQQQVTERSRPRPRYVRPRFSGQRLELASRRVTTSVPAGPRGHSGVNTTTSGRATSKSHSEVTTSVPVRLEGHSEVTTSAPVGPKGHSEVSTSVPVGPKGHSEVTTSVPVGLKGHPTGSDQWIPKPGPGPTTPEPLSGTSHPPLAPSTIPSLHRIRQLFTLARERVRGAGAVRNVTGASSNSEDPATTEAHRRYSSSYSRMDHSGDTEGPRYTRPLARLPPTSMTTHTPLKDTTSATSPTAPTPTTTTSILPLLRTTPTSPTPTFTPSSRRETLQPPLPVPTASPPSYPRTKSTTLAPGTTSTSPVSVTSFIPPAPATTGLKSTAQIIPASSTPKAHVQVDVPLATPSTINTAITPSTRLFSFPATARPAAVGITKAEPKPQVFKSHVVLSPTTTPPASQDPRLSPAGIAFLKKYNLLDYVGKNSPQQPPSLGTFQAPATAIPAATGLNAHNSDFSSLLGLGDLPNPGNPGGNLGFGSSQGIGSFAGESSQLGQPQPSRLGGLNYLGLLSGAGQASGGGQATSGNKQGVGLDFLSGFTGLGLGGLGNLGSLGNHGSFSVPRLSLRGGGPSGSGDGLGSSSGASSGGLSGPGNGLSRSGIGLGGLTGSQDGQGGLGSLSGFGGGLSGLGDIGLSSGLLKGLGGSGGDAHDAGLGSLLGSGLAGGLGGSRAGLGAFKTSLGSLGDAQPGKVASQVAPLASLPPSISSPGPLAAALPPEIPPAARNTGVAPPVPLAPEGDTTRR